MISKNEYLKAKEIVHRFDEQEKEINGKVLIYNESCLIAELKKEEVHNWLDNFFKKRLKNNPHVYSQRVWDSLKECTIVVDGEEFVLPYYDKELEEKWF